MALPPEPPDEQSPPPPPSPVDAAGGECPRCGTPYDPFQEYCLECGLRLPATHGLIPVLATAWRRRVPWYPGDWIWPVLAALVVAALAGGIAILATNDNGSPAKTTSAVNATVTTGGTGTTANTAPTSTETGTGSTASTTAASVPEPPPPPPPAAGGLTVWPQGQNGWTIVLASVPQSGGRAAAVSEARKASAADLSDVGVLNSSEFSSLHSGYFVVFSGVFSSDNEARSALDATQGSYPRAYVRQIVQ